MSTDRQPETPLVLALDVGTSSTRAGLVDARGQHVAGTLARAGYRLATTADGGAELDPHCLLDAVAETVDAALAAAGPLAGEIEAVGVSTFWHSLMGVDAAGEPVTPVFTWADTRAAAAARRLAESLDAEEYHRRTGAVIHPSYPLAKLAWLRETRPADWERAARWLSFAEFLYLCLFGQATCSVSMASGTGLFDQARQVWDRPSLAAIGLSEGRLSTIADDAITGLRPVYARRWLSLADVPWFPAYGDGACSNLGSGAVGRDRLAVMVGTTGAMRLLWDGPAVSPPSGLWLYRLDSRRVVLGGALSEGGNVYDWIRDRFQLPPPDELVAALEAMPPDSHGLTWLPFLAGERSPGWATDARATLSGLTLDTTPVAILRAAFEAVAYRFALIEDLLQEVMPGERMVIASGSGLLRNPVWMQIVADVLNRPVLASAEPEASLRGAGLMALERLGVATDGQGDGLIERLIAEPLAEARRFEPDPRNHRIYREAIARQRDLYRRLIV